MTAASREFDDVVAKAIAAATTKFPASRAPTSLRERWTVLDSVKIGGAEFDIATGTGSVYLYYYETGIVEVRFSVWRVVDVEVATPRDELTPANHLALGLERRKQENASCGFPLSRVVVGWRVWLYDPRTPRNLSDDSPVLASNTFVNEPTYSDIVNTLKLERLEIARNLESARRYETEVAAGGDPEPPEIMPEDADVDNYNDAVAAIMPVIRKYFQAKERKLAVGSKDPEAYIVINPIYAWPNHTA